MRTMFLLCALALTACASQQTQPDKDNPLEQLRNDIKEVAGRPERKADTIQVQHLLVAHKGAGIGGVTRSMDEAETLTAELYAQIQDGSDFDALVKEYTDDSHPGIYSMTMKGEGGKSVYKRTGMVAAFGDVGWRLDVNEVGVAPFHPRNSPYGWHIIKRLK